MRNTHTGQGGSVSPDVQQVGADDSAVIRQDVSSTRHFKGSSALGIIYSFGFSSGQHILLAHPAPGGQEEKQSASLPVSSEAKVILPGFLCQSMEMR